MYISTTSSCLSQLAVTLALVVVLSTSSGRSSNQSDIIHSIFSKIDTNSDKVISMEELQSWMQDDYNLTLTFQIEEEFLKSDLNGDKEVTWSEFLTSNYATTKDGEIDFTRYKNSELENVRAQVRSEKVRFYGACEQNGFICPEKDHLKIDFARFKLFAMPEMFEEMHQVFVELSLMELDENEDGLLQVDEYIKAVSKMYTMRANEDGTTASETDIRREYEYFFSHRDEDKDGLMDFNEILNWVIPEERRGVLVGAKEAEQLFRELDKNEDQALTLDEIEPQFQMFLKNAHPSYYIKMVQNQQGKENAAHDDTSSSQSEHKDESQSHSEDDGMFVEDEIPEHIEL